MNILHIITHYDPVIYGAENFAKHVAEYQASDKLNNVWVITGWWNSSWKETEVINGVNVLRVRCSKLRYVQTLVATIPLFIKASQVFNKNKIDVVHTHIYPGMLVGYLLAKRFSIPFVATIQGGDIGDYDEVFGPFKRIAKKIIGFCLRRANRVHCVSTYLAREVERMGVNKGKITVLPNGVDLKMFTHLKQEFNKNAGVIKIISTSRLEKKNNLTSLVDVIGELSQIGYKLHLDIYGTGSLESEIKSEIKSLNIEDVVSIKGYINQSELGRILPSYQLFVRLSMQEGFGISFIEAMASGVVPVGTKTGGIVDIINDNKDGYLVDLNKDLTEQIKKVLADKNNWDAMKSFARNKVEQLFDWNVILPKVAKLYE